MAPAPVFVLVEPQMGENIGATARAMLNFGISGLRLVKPRDGWPNPKAAAMASGASLVIDQTEIFETLDAALGDCQYVLATTARMRELATPVLEPSAAAVELKKRIDEGQRCAVVFGGERNGLTSDDVARADAVLSIPVNPAFASINLAQAALVAAYEWGQAGAMVLPYHPSAEEAPATKETLSRFFARLESALDDVGYFYPAEKKSGMVRNLRAAFARGGFTESETRTLHGVIKALAQSAKPRE